VKYETILLFRKRNRNFESCNKVSSRRWINAVVLKFQAMAHLGNKYPRRLLAGKWEVRYCSRPFLNHSFPAEKPNFIFSSLCQDAVLQLDHLWKFSATLSRWKRAVGCMPEDGHRNCILPFGPLDKVCPRLVQKRIILEQITFTIHRFNV
jgi:hypothetical protein